MITKKYSTSELTTVARTLESKLKSLPVFNPGHVSNYANSANPTIFVTFYNEKAYSADFFADLEDSLFVSKPYRDSEGYLAVVIQPRMRLPRSHPDILEIRMESRNYGSATMIHAYVPGYDIPNNDGCHYVSRKQLREYYIPHVYPNAEILPERINPMADCYY